MYAEPWPEPLAPEEVARALHGRPGFVWLDGAGPFGAGTGCLSFLGSDPVETRARSTADVDALDVLRGLDTARDGARHRADAPPPSRVPRWVGYIGYDAAFTDPRAPWGPPRNRRERDRPVAWFGRYDAFVAFDPERETPWLVGESPDAVAALRARISRRDVPALTAIVGLCRVAPAADHGQAIRHALDEIARGEVYQINLARRWQAAYDGDPLALFLAMRAASPVPLGLCLVHDGRAVLARTMETFLDWAGVGGAVRTRPIKGTTVRRGDTDAQDASALRADPKEHAEHAMIVDLMRNDLGRVAETGTVALVERLAVEPYARLSHLVSTVAARTRADVNLERLVRETFPPGSVTGTPKVRAIELIEALEPVPRGLYTGTVGHVTWDGGARLAVAIRTAVVEDHTATYFAGGGIVAASDPDREIAETELKARVFLDALDRLRGP